MGLMMGIRIVGPNIWGWIADHFGHRLLIVRLGAFCSTLSFIGVFLVEGFWPLTAVLVTYSLFWNAILAQVEVITVDHLGEEAHRYSRIRLWGSVGFVVLVTLGGYALDFLSLELVPWSIFIITFLIFISTMSMNEKPMDHLTSAAEGFIQTLLKPQVISFLLVCSLMHMSHGPLYYFYSIFLEAEGYRKSTIGLLTALGVIAEIVLFIYMHLLIKRFSANTLLLAALVLTAIRWLMIGGLVDSLFWLAVAQLGHAASFGITHAVAIELVRRYFGVRNAGRGQSLYSSLCYGAGGALGAAGSGWLWENYGAFNSFAAASMVNVVAIVVVVGTMIFEKRSANAL